METLKNIFRRKNRRVNKPVAILAILAILLFGIGAGLAVLPHAHGNDLDHSQHKNCPVYQLSLHSTEFAFVETVGFFVLFFIFFLLLEVSKSLSSYSIYHFHLRAPPIAVQI